MSPRLLVVALLAVAACAGDGGIKDEELEGLVASRDETPAPIDVGKAASSGAELARALATAHQRVGEVGAHTAAITTKIEVKEGGNVVEQLTDETVLEFAADGQFHARMDNSADYGREVLFKEGQLYLRPRYARWHRRKPTDEHEPGAIRDQMYAALGDYFELVAHAAEVSDKGAAEVAGRAGRRLELKLSPSPRKPSGQAVTQRKWREAVTVTALTGEAVLDGERGFPLQATLKATLVFTRDGRSFDMSLEVTHALAGFGAPVELTVPPAEEIIDTPLRLREVDERDALLEGMAPPARPSGTTQGPTGRGPEPTAPPPPPPPGKAGGE